MSDLDGNNQPPRVESSNTKLPKALVNPNIGPEELARRTTSQSIPLSLTSPVKLSQEESPSSDVDPNAITRITGTQEIRSATASPLADQFGRTQPVVEQLQSASAPAPVASKSKTSLFVGILGGVACLAITLAFFAIMRDKNDPQVIDPVENVEPVRNVEPVVEQVVDNSDELEKYLNKNLIIKGTLLSYRFDDKEKVSILSIMRDSDKRVIRFRSERQPISLRRKRYNLRLIDQKVSLKGKVKKHPTIEGEYQLIYKKGDLGPQ